MIQTRRWNASASVYKPFCQFPLDAAEETYKRIIAVLVKTVMLRHSIAFATSSDVPVVRLRPVVVAADFIVMIKTIGTSESDSD